MPELKPCPLCGELPIVNQVSGHIICCKIVADDIYAWNALHRAQAWKNEPPSVAGKFWWRDKRHPDEVSIINLTQTKLDDYRRRPIGPNEQFAGPIPEPVEE